MSDFESLAEHFVSHEGPPVDYLHVAASLEARGYSDRIIRDRYDLPDSFSLARRIMSNCYEIGNSCYYSENRRRKRADWVLFATSCTRGVMTIFPVFLFLLALAFGSASLWGNIDAAATQINSMALALVVSMIISGGFGKALATHLSEIISLEADRGAVRLLTAYIIVSLLSTTAVASLAMLVFLGSVDPAVILIYTTGLCLIWLCLFALYSLHHEWLYAPVFAAGVLVSLIFKEIFLLNYIETQALGIFLIAAASLVCTVIILKKMDTKGPAVIHGKTSWFQGFKPAQFTFGLIYFGMLFADRVANWVVDGSFMFRAGYEISLNLAIFSLLLGSGILEYRMVRFWQDIVNCRRTPEMPISSQVLRFLAKSMVLYIAAAVVGILISILFSSIVDAGQKIHVVSMAAPAYALLAWGSFACSIYMGFKRWKAAILSGAAALAVNITVSFCVSRQGEPDLAVTGLLAGSLVFFIAGTILIFRVARNFAYFRHCSS